MDQFILGPLYARKPGMAFKPFPHETGGHTHNEDHVTVVWGKHRVLVEAPILDTDGKQKIDVEGELLFFLEKDFIVMGKGPDSLLFIHKNKRHNLIALEPDCYHACLFLHKDGEGKTSREWQGYLEATY